MMCFDLNAALIDELYLAHDCRNFEKFARLLQCLILNDTAQNLRSQSLELAATRFSSNSPACKLADFENAMAD
jgi:hypothetical protein